MKRFHSNLQKVLEICQQQSRLAELELARERSRLRHTQKLAQQAAEQLEEIRTDVNHALPQARQMTLILGMHQHLAVADEHLQKMNAECRKAEQLCEQARARYQECHSKVERIERMIDQQRSDYRRDALREQQAAMDDIAVFRWQPSEIQETEVTNHG